MNSGWIRGKWIVAGAILGAFAFASGAAKAEEGENKEGTAKEEAKESPAEEKAEAAEGEHKHAADGADLDQADDSAVDMEEASFYAWADFVLGFGKEPVAIQSPPTSSGPTIPGYTAKDARATSESMMVGLLVEASENVHIGAKIPLLLTEFSPSSGESSRGTGNVGNLELEAAYVKTMSPTSTFYGILGITLPTAGGDVLPENLADRAGTEVDQGAYDKAQALRAANFARGMEQSALFEPHRFGINPKLAVALKAGQQLTITPAVKMENLISTSSTNPHSYLGELVPSVTAQYQASEHLEPVLKIWANAAFAGSDEDKKFSVAVEPQLLMKFGGFHPGLGVILPVAGAPADPYFLGVRLYAGGAF